MANNAITFTRNVPTERRCSFYYSATHEMSLWDMNTIFFCYLKCFNTGNNFKKPFELINFN